MQNRGAPQTSDERPAQSRQPLGGGQRHTLCNSVTRFSGADAAAAAIAAA